MTAFDDDHSLCPIVHSTGLVGDRWSILIVRELLMGQGRFQDIQAQTGATSQMLSARLRRLESDGLVARQAYSLKPLRYEYSLTPKGRNLMPVILALRAWGEQWVKPEGSTKAVRMFHRPCGSELELNGHCPSCQRLAPWTEMAASPSQAWLEERQARAKAFAETLKTSTKHATESDQ